MIIGQFSPLCLIESKYNSTAAGRKQPERFPVHGIRDRTEIYLIDTDRSDMIYPCQKAGGFGGNPILTDSRKPQRKQKENEYERIAGIFARQKENTEQRNVFDSHYSNTPGSMD